MKRKQYSDDSEDNAPLTLFKKNCIKDITNHNVNSYSNLCKPSIVQCEFCDSTFNNRYNYFIHNAKHIIIPLINHTVYQCKECIHHFTTIKNLNDHVTEKHPHTTLKNNSNRIVLEKGKKEKILESIFEKELIVQLHGFNVEPLLRNGYNKKSENSTESPSHDTKTPIKIEMLESLVRNGYNKTPERNDSEHLQNGLDEVRKSVKNRIVFEEDLEDDLIQLNSNGLLKDLTTDCRVNLNVYDVPWWKNVVSPQHETDFEVKNFEKKPELKPAEEKVEPVYTKSVHYLDLIKPGFYRCKKCGMSFPNRYKTIIHETEHLKFRRRKPHLCVICEKLIGCRKRLKRHYKEVHPGQKPTNKHVSKCKKCGLPYCTHSKHVLTYHRVYSCGICAKGFLTADEKVKHFDDHLHDRKCPKCDYEAQSIEVDYHMELVHNYVKTGDVKMCDMCVAFLKNRPPFYYVVVGEVSEIGVRHPCEKCGKVSFELKTVQRFRRVFPKVGVNEVKEKPKSSSNQMRLKNIQNRLKMLKLKL